MKKPYRKHLSEKQSLKVKMLLIQKKATQADVAKMYGCRVDFINGIINCRRKATPKFFNVIDQIKQAA